MQAAQFLGAVNEIVMQNKDGCWYAGEEKAKRNAMVFFKVCMLIHIFGLQKWRSLIAKSVISVM